MKNVSDFVAIHSRLYPSDTIKLARLLITVVHQHIGQAMLFKSGNLDEKTHAVLFGMGEFVHDGDTYVIDSVVVEDRRIQVKTIGPSPVAAACFEALVAIFRDQGVMTDEAPIATMDQCSLVATLDFDFGELFSPAVSTLAAGVTSVLRSQGANAVVVPRSFAFEVLFAQTEGERDEYIMREARKFTIEPRAMTAVGARRFFCAGPVDSATMERLVQDLEATVVAQRAS